MTLIKGGENMPNIKPISDLRNKANDSGGEDCL